MNDLYRPNDECYVGEEDTGRDGQIRIDGWCTPVTTIEEHRIGIEVELADGTRCRPRWKRYVTDWLPDGEVDAVVKESDDVVPT